MFATILLNNTLLQNCYNLLRLPHNNNLKK